MLAETLGHYRILRPLGKGGMGEVYAAQDTKLGRSVALKVLPQALAADPSRRERFEREARAVAALNHPHIVTIHSVEEADGVPFLTMELIDGRRLSELIPPQGMALDGFLQLAVPLADAVSAAHKRGIVHRDLKPANVMVTEEGQLKVLDFGLAKLKEAVLSAEELGSDLATWEETGEGKIVGTAAYMSPEQAEGKPVDARSDVFSLGIVIYEMTTGRRPFQGDSSAGTLSSILKDTPVPVSELRPELPSEVGRIIRRCLEKDPGRRMQTALDLKNELEDLKKDSDSGQALQEAPAPALRLGAARARSRTWWLGRVLWLVAAAAAGAGLLKLGTARPLAERPVVRWAIALPPAQSVAVGYASAVAVSPDGTQLAYVAAHEGRSRIYLRALDRLEAKPIPGTEDGNGPFFSPDGRWLGSFAEREHRLKKVPLGGGAPLTLCDVAQVRGASWSPDGSIVFTRDGASALDRVSAEGGTPQALTTLDASRRESSHRLPEVLPGGEAVVFTVKADDTASFGDARIEAVSLRTHQRSVLISGGTSARYAASGHLIYGRAGALWAVPFDPARLQVTGPSVAVLEGVWVSEAYGNADFGLSDSSLVYVPGKPGGAARRILRVARSGNARSLMDGRRAFTGSGSHPMGAESL